MAEYAEPSMPTAFAAQRCKYDLDAQPDKENTTACADINAGTMHILMTNMIALNNLVIIRFRILNSFLKL